MIELASGRPIRLLPFPQPLSIPYRFYSIANVDLTVHTFYFAFGSFLLKQDPGQKQIVATRVEISKGY